MRILICVAVALLLTTLITKWVFVVVFADIEVAMIFGVLLGLVLSGLGWVVADLWWDYDHGLL